MSWHYGCRTGKRCYPTAADVRQALRGTRKTHKRQKPYHCKVCGCFHMTHFLHETRAKAVARTVFQRGTR